MLGKGLLTVVAADLDAYAGPYIGIDPGKQRKRVKVQLVEAFLPLEAQKLSRQLVLQTLASNLGSDPNLTEALLTDAGLLSDPSPTGRPLLATFLPIVHHGVNTSIY